MIWQTLLGVNALVTIFSGIFTLFLIMMQKCFNFQIYTFYIRKSNKGKIQEFIEKKNCISIYKSIFDHKEYIHGPICSFSKNGFFVGNIFIEKKEDGGLIFKVFCSQSIKKQIIELHCFDEAKQIDESSKQMTDFYNRIGSCYYSLSYTKVSKDISNRYIIQEGTKQAYIVKDIVENYNKTNRDIEINMKGKKRFSNVFIFGNPGSGKTVITMLVAHLLKASYCDEFDPTDPGDNLPNLLEYVEVSKDHPLVIVINESDVMIHKVHYNLIERHKNIPISVSNKTQMNKFREKIEFFPNILLIETSNVSKETIDTLDPSYLREGRIDKVYNL